MHTHHIGRSTIQTPEADRGRALAEGRAHTAHVVLPTFDSANATDTPRPADRIMAGIGDAIAFANGDITRAVLHTPDAADLQGEVERLTDTSERMEVIDGELDEIVVAGGAHLERMSRKGWFLSLARADGSEVAIWLRGKVTMFEDRPPAALPRLGQSVAASLSPAPVTQAQGWQDISTAPRDGTTVILWVVTEYAPQGHMLWPCKVIYDDWCWEISDNAHLDYDYQILEDMEITHWMPLPAAPVTEGGK